MELSRDADACRAQLDAWRADGRSIGFVPTMGAFHDGHRSLMHRARAECDRVLVSLFVNPLQFVQGEDFDRYPRDEDRDALIAQAEGGDLLLVPTVDDIYPDGYPPKETIDPGPIGDVLEGAARPGHFRGVLTVVDRLFTIAGASRAYFGEKDAQQLFLITRMAAERHPEVAIVPCPTVREPDGLAMSSRNAYLSPKERAVAEIVPRALVAAVTLVTSGERDPERLRAVVGDVVAAEPLARLDYAEVVDDAIFQPVTEDLQKGGRYRVLIAVRVGTVRLLDNRSLHISHARLHGSGRCR